MLEKKADSGTNPLSKLLAIPKIGVEPIRDVNPPGF